MLSSQSWAPVALVWFEGVEQAGVQALGVSVVDHLYVQEGDSYSPTVAERGLAVVRLPCHGRTPSQCPQVPEYAVLIPHAPLLVRVVM